MFDFSPVQIIIVLVIALVVFGPKRLPEMGRNLGRSLREFKGSISGETTQTHDDPTAGGDLPKVVREEAVARHQETPAATPEIAEAEAADADASRSDAHQETPAATREIAEAEVVDEHAERVAAGKGASA